jgi:alpha-1,2-mannosyltransferase
MTPVDVAVNPAQQRQNKVPPGTLAGGIALAACVAVLAYSLYGRAFFAADFQVFHLGGAALLDGASPYDIATESNDLKFIYTPFAAIAFAPLGLMGMQAAFALWTFISVLALEAVIWFALTLVDSGSRDRRARLTPIAALAAIPLSPVFWNIGLGQVNLILMVLVIVDLAGGPGRFRGVAIGIAAGIKLTPLIFVLYFLITRRFREAVVSMVSFAGTVALGFLLLPASSVRYWSELVLDIERMMPAGAESYIQSIRGMLWQLPDGDVLWRWLPASVVVGIGGLAIAAWAGRRGAEPAGIAACALTGLLVTPVAWTPQWVWFVPVLVFMAWYARTPAAKLGVGLVWGVLVTSGVLTYVATGPWAVLNNILFTLIGLAMLVAIAIHLWRTARE